MKTTILSIAAAAAITLGTAGAASAATPAANAGLFDGASAAKTQQVYYGGGWGWRHRHYRHRRMCRRLYYKGFVRGNPFARRLFYRLCRRHHRFYRGYY
jgi:poly(3-hydroxybutyrate) depolymerase